MNNSSTNGEYAERLHMSWWWWLIVGLFAFSLVVAVVAWTPPGIGAIASAAICGLALWGVLAAGSTRILADGQGLQVGRSRIEWRWVDRVRACDAATMETVMHSTHQIGSFVVTRPWISSGVVLRLSDPADPHPAWIVSTRHPDALAAVVRGHLERTSQDPRTTTNQEPAR